MGLVAFSRDVGRRGRPLRIAVKSHHGYQRWWNTKSPGSYLRSGVLRSFRILWYSGNALYLWVLLHAKDIERGSPPRCLLGGALFVSRNGDG